MTGKSKKILFVGSLGIIILTMFVLIRRDFRSCMKVPIISEEKLNTLTEVTTLDISQIAFNGADVSIDLPNNSIYISQNYNDLKKAYMMQGELKAKNPEYSLFFLDTVVMGDIPLAVQEGVPLPLIIKYGESYQRVNLIVTTLPILYLDLEGTDKMEDGRDLMHGNLTLWDNFDLEMKRYKVTTGLVQWHVRGNSTKIYDKLSWKMELKKNNGDNKNLELLGLGSDDDWILNAMSMDDTRIKEKLAQTLWNQIVSNTNYDYKMSSGEYVELFINGAYQGLYLLQRRVDEKYLGLNREADIVFKGRNTWEADSLGAAYEIVSSPYDKETSYDILEKTLGFIGENRVNTNSFIDLSVMLQFLSAKDNSGYKNMFYILKKMGNGYELYFVPWDTDLSLGATWTYDYEDSVDEIIERRELDIFRKKDSEIEKKIAERWNVLRKNIFLEKNIYLVLDEIVEQLKVSGAMKRNKERWGELNEGEDNEENLRLYIQERLAFVDEYYKQFVKN